MARKFFIVERKDTDLDTAKAAELHRLASIRIYTAESNLLNSMCSCTSCQKHKRKRREKRCARRERMDGRVIGVGGRVRLYQRDRSTQERKSRMGPQNKRPHAVKP